MNDIEWINGQSSIVHYGEEEKTNVRNNKTKTFLVFYGEFFRQLLCMNKRNDMKFMCLRLHIQYIGQVFGKIDVNQRWVPQF